MSNASTLRVQTSAQPIAGSVTPADDAEIAAHTDALVRAIAAKAVRDAALLGGSIVLRATGQLRWQAGGQNLYAYDGLDRCIEYVARNTASRFERDGTYQLHSNRFDAAGREWSYFSTAVMDDFGNLVEVAR